MRVFDSLLITAVLLGGSAGATAQATSTAATIVTGFERITLPADESLGLAHLSYLIEASPGWWVGPAIYGAASGSRGGFFTWGVEGQRQWTLGGRWRLATGLYAGGGGGAGSPVGGGLMLRPHADVLYDAGGWSVGVSASRVVFPGGDIGSNQFGLVLTADDVFTPAERGLFRPKRLVLSAGAYDRAPGRTGFLVLRAEQSLNATVAATVEAGSAVSGGADGYAEFLAGAVALWPAQGAPVRVGARIAVGLGGGGAVPTGGGVFGKVALLGLARLSRTLSLEIEAGRARAADGDLDTRYAALALAFECCHQPVDTEWSLGLQHYRGAQRRDGRVEPMEILGLKLRESLGGGWYSMAQASGAVSGGAGAYSVGLLGVGTRHALDDAGTWRVGAEMLIGAAGGGGVSSSGGAVAQPMLWADAGIGALGRMQFGIGVMRSLRGELSTPLVELSWVVPLGLR